MPAETHVSKAPLDRDEIFEIVRDRLADILEIDPSTITEGQSFADDLDADSLALIELVEALEEELGERTVGFRIEDEDLEDLKTVRDAVDYVHERVEVDRASPCPLRSRDLDGLTRAASATGSPTRSLLRPGPGPPLVVRRDARAAESNERLEFLGDAVLGWVDRRPRVPPLRRSARGQLTDLRKSVVNAIALAEVAVDSTSGRTCCSARVRRRPAGADKPSILSDALEAVLGAVYLDGGPQAAYGLVERLLGAADRPTAAVHARPADHKTQLQELTRPRRSRRPVYVLREEGPTTPSVLRRRCSCDGERRRRG